MSTRYDRWRDAHRLHKQGAAHDGEDKPASIRPHLVRVVPNGDAR